jgi:hypothetical protein
MFVTDSFSATRNSITARCFKRTLTHHEILTTPAHALENVLFRGAAVASGTFQINHRIRCRHFLLILTEVQKVLLNILGNPRILTCAHVSFKINVE